MNGSWAPAKLGDLVDIRHGFAFNGECFRDEPPGDILLTPGNFKVGGGFKADKLKYYAGPVPDGFILTEGDLLVTMTDLSKSGDTLGYPAIVPVRHDARFLHNQRLGKVLVRPGSAIDTRFLYYLLCSRAYRNEVLASATGTTVKHTSPTRICAFEFMLPPVEQQRTIATVLGALDDKIELNRRMNETLEAMARAIFKSWFVDFDPVRAKAEGRQPFGMDAETGALFPDSFEESPLGKIPRGWAAATLSDFADVDPESWTEKSAPPEIDYVDLANVKWGRIETTARYAWKEAPSRARRVLRPGDTIVGTVRPGNGSYALVSQTGLTGSTGFAILRPCWPDSRELVYLAATAPETIESLAHLADGAAYPAIRPNVVAATHVVKAPDAIVKRFNASVCSLLARAASNDRESRTLADIRDMLLPKLMSGKLRLSDSERVVAEDR